MINVQLSQLEQLKQIIDFINSGDLNVAKAVAIRMRDNLQEEIDKMESDIDIQLSLENDSKYGKWIGRQ